MRISKLFFAGILFAGVIFMSASSRGAAFIYHLGETFSGDSPSSVNPPWVTTLFEDVSPGSVRLTMTASSLTGNENVDELYFNLNPALDPLLLNISVLQSSGGFDLPQFNLGVNQFKADGDGRYDLKLTFANAGMNVNRFTAGESLVLYLTGIPSLNVFDFTYLSAPDGGVGPFYAAGHIQRITNSVGTTSGWISPMGGTFQLVPEPTAASLLFAGLMAFAIRLRR